MKKSIIEILRLPIAILANSTVATGANADLPPLAGWRAPSFWAMAVSVVCGLAALQGVDLLAVIGVASQSELVNVIVQLVGIVAGVWAWVERQSPRYSLTLRGQR